MSAAPQKFEVVVFGATSFVGKLLCEYLAELNNENLHWAMAARSPEKLQALAKELSSKPGSSPIPTIIADVNDPHSLMELCQQAQLVVSTVGPYSLHGEPLIKACVENGTDYCDLSGEVQWMRRMIDRYQARAEASGARIVHCCGFDSIPSDLGVLFIQEASRERFGQYCGSVAMRVKTMKGGFSGGTVASMIESTKEILKDAEARRQLGNPYLLCPSNHGFTVQQPQIGVDYDEDCKSWQAPFVMATINTRVVHRSNALAGAPYGMDFCYSEAMLCGDGSKGKSAARRMNFGLKVFAAAVAFAPTRWLLQRFVLPKPGEGPSPEQQRAGHFDLRFIGRTSDGLSLVTIVTGDRDPGYGSTAKMLGQAALCLARDIPKSQVAGGFWTPASALGKPLIARLQGAAGLTFELVGDSPQASAPQPMLIAEKQTSL